MAAADVLQLQPLPPDLQDALDTPFGGTEGILTARAALMRDFEVGFSFENYPSGLRAPTIPDEDKVSTCGTLRALCGLSDRFRVWQPLGVVLWRHQTVWCIQTAPETLNPFTFWV